MESDCAGGLWRLPLTNKRCLGTNAAHGICRQAKDKPVVAAQNHEHKHGLQAIISRGPESTGELQVSAAPWEHM